MRAGILAAIMAIGLVSCGSVKSEAQRLKFCPPNTEEDTRLVLDLGSTNEISLGELFRRLDALGLKHEDAKADNVVHKCENVEPIPNARSYKVYAGVDSSRKFSRNYLVVVDESEAVRYIEARHAYRAP